MAQQSNPAKGARLPRALWGGALAALLTLVQTPPAVAQPGAGGLNQSSKIPNELMVKFTASVSASQAREIIQRAGAQVVGDPILDGRLFHVRTSDSRQLADVKHALESAPGVEYVESNQTVSIPPSPK